MRNRDKKISDFGLTKGEIYAVYERCKHLSDAEAELLRSTANDACPPMIADFVFESLVHGISYDVAYQRYQIPIGRDDFYGYRRKTAAAFWRVFVGTITE